MGAKILVDDMNLLARLHMRRAIPQSPRQREVTFSVEDVANSLFRIREAPSYGLVFGQSQEIEDLASTAYALYSRQPATTRVLHAHSHVGTAGSSKTVARDRRCRTRSTSGGASLV